MHTRMVEVRTRILKENDVVARRLRDSFVRQGLLVVSLVSSPGTGKTKFLEETLKLLRPHFRVAAIVGDLATDNDARRQRGPVCRSSRSRPARFAIWKRRWSRTCWPSCRSRNWICFFIENVGNLVCPASYDLGEALRVVLFSVTEGEDKPLKYPTIFNTADLAVVTKMDLADAVEFDLQAAQGSVQAVRPGLDVLTVSAKTGQGMAGWIAVLQLHQRLFRGIAGWNRPKFLNRSNSVSR